MVDGVGVDSDLPGSAPHELRSPGKGFDLL